MAKRALITGITGQDGSYLADLLLKKGYKVFGLESRRSIPRRDNINHILDELCLLSGDLTDLSSLIYAINESQPCEVYNLAAQSFVGASWKQRALTANVTAIGVANILEAIKIVNPQVRFYQASTSELYSGNPEEAPQDEETNFDPQSPYGIAKLYAHKMTTNGFRKAHDMFACCGILFNHESPRRGIEFVTRKITDAVARIKNGFQKKLELGNLDAKRDWGYAGDYVEAMWLMLQQNEPEDYVIATGKTHSVRKFAKTAFAIAGISIESNGETGTKEKYFRKDTGNIVLEINPLYFRPAEVNLLVGNASKAKKKLGWRSQISFNELVGMMVEADLVKYS